ncbi:hypothetical protein HJC23_012029 [Cyclotella cryptica]|uniref:UBX domain-containing protein n=1 Tax=Cyclotella cryptica TaxID=29204 RepID=A0ABD3PRH5_9STRA|eukprot:CCRYP_012325-RA/>CCRYP_012325-RA protein AED:0.01 eAED:0.01 QI:101/1/1/1/0/0/2/517/542
MRNFWFTLLSLLAFIASANNSPTIIRVRILDGSVIRVPLQDDASSTTLTSLLSSAGVNVDSQNKDFEVRVGTPGRSTRDLKLSGSDIDKTAAELGLEHGSMLTLVSTKAPGPPNTSAPSTQKPDSEDGYRYDPFPDLAKSTSFSALSRRSRALAGASRGRSYGDVSRVREAMHTVEPQSDGPLGRVYVCRVGAARFQNHCVVSNSASVSGAKKKSKQKSEPQIENRIGLLFGTINKERVDQSRKIARTSLSSTREDQKMCDVAKVHAIWEPPLQTPLVNGRHYDEDCLLASYPGVSSEARGKETNPERAIRVASYLGLRPIGWIFSYADENRHEDGDALPVHGRDAIVGSKLQIETMKLLGRDEGKKFVTLALDGRVGATEAFQLSDVCVQMVAEGVLTAPIVDETLKSTRYVTLRDPVVVAGDETKQLDSVLLLINTAMLSHVGLYSGGENASPGGNVKRNSGALLAKTRKRILSALEGSESGRVLQELCDFDVLLALDTMIGRDEMKELCELVKKFARGQKKGARLGDHLRLTLQSLLGG